MNVSVELYLKDHCIETAVKKEYKRLVDVLITDEDSAGKEAEEKLELLREYIETTDFSKLRSSDERLSGMRESHVVLSRTADGDIQLKILN